MTTTPPQNPQPSQEEEEEEAKEEVFRFLDLPAELRNQIYNLTLPARVRVRPVSPLARSVNQYRDALALLRTSHQIRNEARPLLFSNSIFHIHLYHAVDWRHFRAWIDGAGAGLVSRMKYVHVGVVVETRLVRVDVRVGEAGAFVGCLASDARFLERVCGEFNMCVLGRKTGFPACGQQSVMLTYVRDGEWKGYFPRITDMKTILCAVRECVDFCGVPMADQIRLDSWT